MRRLTTSTGASYSVTIASVRVTTFACNDEPARTIETIDHVDQR